MLINGRERRHFEVRQRPEADVTWAYPVDLKSVEPVQKPTNKCKQRINPELNDIIVLKLRHEWHTTISFWARMNLTRGRLFKMAQILTLKRNYNPRQSRDRPCDVRAIQVSPSRLRIWLPVQPYRRPSSNLDYFPISMISGIFRDYYCGIFGYCFKHYIFKTYFLRMQCPFK